MARVGRFELKEELGRGAMGLVHRAWDPLLAREVAVKQVRALGLAARQRAQVEAEAMARVQDPGLVTLHEVSGEGGDLVLVMDLVPGETLESRLRRTGPLPEEEAARVALGLARTLSRLHARGVVHRDLKPGNVMLRPDGQPVLLDLGLALIQEQGRERLSRPGELMGTPSYMAPEQARGDMHSVGAPADVHALGGLLHAMLTGRPPFEGDSALALLAALQDSAASGPAALRPGLDPRLDALCLRCLAKAPGERPGAEDVAIALEGVLRSPPAPLRRVRALAPLALLLVALVGWGGVTLVTPGAPPRPVGATPSPPASAATRRAPPPPAPARSAGPVWLAHDEAGEPPLLLQVRFLGPRRALTWGRGDRRLRVWDLGDPVPRPFTLELRARVLALDLLPGQPRGLAALGEAGDGPASLVRFDLEAGTEELLGEQGDARVVALALAPDGARAALVRDLPQGDRVELVELGSRPPAGGPAWDGGQERVGERLAWASDGRSLLLGCVLPMHPVVVGTVRRWRWAEPGAPQERTPQDVVMAGLTALTLSPDGALVAAGDDGRQVVVLRAADLTPLHLDREGKVDLVGLAVQPRREGQGFVTAGRSHSGLVRALRFAGGRLWSLSGEPASKGHELANELRGWELPGGANATALLGLPPEPCSLDVSPDGTLVLFGFAHTGRAELWETAALPRGAGSYPGR